MDLKKQAALMFFDMNLTAIPLYEAFEAKLLERFPYPLESDRVAVKQSHTPAYGQRILLLDPLKKLMTSYLHGCSRHIF